MPRCFQHIKTVSTRTESRAACCADNQGGTAPKKHQASELTPSVRKELQANRPSSWKAMLDSNSFFAS